MEQTPRAGYVGKGVEARLRGVRRNEAHQVVSCCIGFTRDVVFVTSIEALAFEAEKEWIADLHTYVHDPLWNGIGCNMTTGGDGISGFKFSEESNVQMRKRTRRENLRPETLERMSVSQKKRPKPSLVTRQRMSRAHKGKPMFSPAVIAAKVQKQLKPVEQLSLDGDVVACFPSVKAAYAATGIFNISMCCRGVRSVAGGFKWRWLHNVGVSS